MDWNITGERFIELTTLGTENKVAINVSSIAAFGMRKTQPVRGSWVTLKNQGDGVSDIIVDESYEHIRAAIQGRSEP